MSRLRIELDDGRQGFEPGHRLTGKVSWNLGQRPESLELHLLWKTEGKAASKTSVVHTHPVPAAGASGEHRFEIPLPRGPWSFSARLIQLKWFLELVAGKDHHERVELVLAPGGREKNLLEDFKDVS